MVEEYEFVKFVWSEAPLGYTDLQCEVVDVFHPMRSVYAFVFECWPGVAGGFLGIPNTNIDC